MMLKGYNMKPTHRRWYWLFDCKHQLHPTSHYWHMTMSVKVSNLSADAGRGVIIGVGITTDWCITIK